MSEAVSSLLLFARCLFCQRLECLPSWHRLRLWQRQCTTSPRGRRDLGPRGGRGVRVVEWEELRELNRGSKMPVLPPFLSFPFLPPIITPPHPPARHLHPFHQRACATSAEAAANSEPSCMSVHRCQSKSCHHRHQGPQPPPAKVGQLSPHIIPIDCLLLCLPIPSIGFVSLDDALHSTSPTLIHTVITFQYQR